MRHKLATDPAGLDQTIEDFCGFRGSVFVARILKKALRIAKIGT
jgi:hypothetical protein